MILVTLGTQDKSFERLLIKIDELIEREIIKEKVVVQAGFTKYKSKNMETFNLIPKDEFDELIKESNFVISHGGVGTILTALNNNKKVIGVARLKKYKEHVNDHQVELIENFSKDGHIIGVSNLDELESSLEKIKNFKPQKYKEEKEKFVKRLNKEIEDTKSRQMKILARIMIFFFTLILLALWIIL